MNELETNKEFNEIATFLKDLIYGQVRQNEGQVTIVNSIRGINILNYNKDSFYILIKPEGIYLTSERNFRIYHMSLRQEEFSFESVMFADPQFETKFRSVVAGVLAWRDNWLDKLLT